MAHFHAVLDYPDEDIDPFRMDELSAILSEQEATLNRLLASCRRGKQLTRGISCAIVGRPNAGKSSLLNALAGYDRVIVTDIPGTTRDTVEEVVKVAGVKLRLIDTAGIRDTADTVEAIGVERSRKAVEQADMVIFVCDGSKALTDEDRAIIEICCDRDNAVALINKADLGQVVEPGDLPFMNVVEICANTGEGLEQFADVVEMLFGSDLPCDGSILTNARQFDAIRRAYDAMERSLKGLRLGLTPDMVLIDVEEAMEAMGEVTGNTVREDITARIFERFCVGK
jgi:tRNA modification GTPase